MNDSSWLCMLEVLLGEPFMILCFGFYVVYSSRTLVIDEFHLIDDQLLSQYSPKDHLLRFYQLISARTRIPKILRFCVLSSELNGTFYVILYVQRCSNCTRRIMCLMLSAW